MTDTEWNSIEGRDVLEYSSETETYRATFDSTIESVHTAIVSTVAAVLETHPLELPPLYSVVDPTGLETLVEPTVASSSGGDIHISFTLNGCNVTVHSYGIIAVQPSQEESQT